MGIIKEKISGVSEKFSETKGEFKIMEWLTTFHSDMQKSEHLHLDVTELHQLGRVHQLKDVSHFTKEVMKGLKKLKSTLINEFDYNMLLTEMDKWMKKPHEHLLEDIAGCTA